MRPYRIVVLVAFLILTVSASFAQVPAPHVNEIYGGFWETGPTTSTDLTVEAKGVAVNAILTLYSSTGKKLLSQTLNLDAGLPSHLDLGTLLSEQEEGGLVLRWNGGENLVRGTVMVSRENGIRATYPLKAGERFDTEKALYAPWYFPDSSSIGTLSLYNSGLTSLAVHLSAENTELERDLGTVTVNPASTRLINLKSILAEKGVVAPTTGAIVLRYYGETNTLHPILLLENPTTAFALVPSFAAKHEKVPLTTTSWQFPYVPISNSNTRTQLIPYALITNGSGEKISPQLTLLSVAGKRPQQQSIEMSALSAHETRLVNLSTEIGNVDISGSRFGMSIVHAGSPGTLAISVFSTTSSGIVVNTSDGFVLPTSLSNVNYWISEPKHTQYLVKNLPSPGAFVTLFYQGSQGIDSYTVPLPSARSSGVGLDLDAALHSGRKDTGGAFLPSGVRGGLLFLSSAKPSTTQFIASQPACLQACATATSATITSASLSSEPTFSPENAPNFPCCSAKLMYRVTYIKGINTHRNHTFWWVKDSNGTQWIIDAGPSNAGCPSFQCGYLNDWVVSGVPPFHGHYPEDNTDAAMAWTSGPCSGQFCDEVNTMLTFANTWPNNNTSYRPYGPNSNTFAHQVANAAGLSPTTPPSAPGW